METMSECNTISILFFGDIVGKAGRNAVKTYLEGLTAESRPDVIIANAENVTHGFGLSQKHYNELLESGIDILTGGNHTWDRREILNYIANADQLLRPGNVPGNVPGVGHKIFTFGGFKLGVINLMGQVFMGNYNSPWTYLEAAVAEIKAETPIIFLDFHAEATAEKVGLGHFASDLGVSAMVGTHTHVQTADDRILNEQTGYLSDAGFNGAYHSVIGMEVSGSIFRQQSTLPNRLDVAESHEVQVNGVLFAIDRETGGCQNVQRINQRLTLTPELLPEEVAY